MILVQTWVTGWMVERRHTRREPQDGVTLPAILRLEGQEASKRGEGHQS